MNELTFKKIYIKIGDRPQMEEFKDVVLTSNGIKMTLSKSFTTAAIANKQGLIGILLNKLFSSMMKKEEFEFSFQNVKKITLSTSIVMGRKMHNMMFWNKNSSEANYENIDFSMSPPPKKIAEVKQFLAPLLRKVDFEELEPETY